MLRTIKRTADTGGLNRDRVREAVIRLRERKRAAGARLSPYRVPHGTGVLIARERPIQPYGQAPHAPEVLPGEAEEGEET